jgi:hypothetical protein
MAPEIIPPRKPIQAKLNNDNLISIITTIMPPINDSYLAISFPLK